MRHLPFKTLILCVLLPPLVYSWSLHLLEAAVEKRYARALEDVAIGDTRPLFDGSVRLQEALATNIDAFIAARTLVRWGVELQILVKTTDGIYLYPYLHDEGQGGAYLAERMAIARDNYRLLSTGLIKRVHVQIGHQAPLALALLAAVAGAALGVLAIAYRRATRLMDREQKSQQEMLDGMTAQHHHHLSQLQRLQRQRAGLTRAIERINAKRADERRRASSTEDEMFGELIDLETRIAANLAQQDRQRDEIERLEQKVRQLERQGEGRARQRSREIDASRRRFQAVYKNTALHERALAGFAALSEEMKIKAEEVVHQLDADPKAVTVKRKVFGKKNRETVFEVIFAYRGRLYFRNLAGNRIEILAIGTKLTQAKDLSFLDQL